jgi:hypothetical protein
MFCQIGYAVCTCMAVVRLQLQPHVGTALHSKTAAQSCMLTTLAHIIYLTAAHIARASLKVETAAGEVSQTQLKMGLSKVKTRLEDSALDCPNAAKILEDIIQRGQQEKWLEVEG